MNNDEKIIKYIDDQMSYNEKKIFEREILESEELQRELHTYRSIKNKIGKVKNIEVNESYFNSILPRFLGKYDKRSQPNIYKRVGYAVSVIAMFIFSFSLINLIYNEKEDSIELIEFTRSLNENEKIELLTNLNGELESEYFEEFYTKYFTNDLSKTINTFEDGNLIAETYDIDFEEPAEYLTARQFENIYNELISLKFMN